MTAWLTLLAAGLVAGLLNTMAGGGSFVTLPALIGAGLPSVAANASTTLALYPGGIAAAWVYRDGLGNVCGVPLRAILATTLIGGFAGAMLLLWTPSNVFDRVLPWLLLVATLGLMFGTRLGPILRARFRTGVTTVLVTQLLLGIYGGYFGGAAGLMMMAAWSMLDEADLKALNAPRMLMVSAYNTTAVVIFIIAGAVRWPESLLVGAGALVGSWSGAGLGKRLPRDVVKAVTVTFAALMTAVFFVRAYR